MKSAKNNFKDKTLDKSLKLLDKYFEENHKNVLDSKIIFRKAWSPNLIQRWLIKLKLMKDKRYVYDKDAWMKWDEAGHFQSGKYFSDYWNACGVDTYKNKKNVTTNQIK